MKFSLCNSSLLYLLGLNVIEVAHDFVPKIKKLAFTAEHTKFF